MVVLECNGLTKKFGGLEAVKQVSLKVEKGEHRLIIGPNGAGKTTLFNLISGELAPTSGNIELFGRDIIKLPAHKRTHLGLGRTFQIVSIFLTQSVLDNLIIAEMGLLGLKFSMLKPVSSYRHLYARAEEIMEKVGLAEKPNTIVKNLSHGEQRQVEIAMALIGDPRVLLLDEPTAGLSQAEGNSIVNMIKNLHGEITAIIIEHDMDVAFELADFITVLDLGQVYAEGTAKEIRGNAGVQAIYLGTE
jgi:branched-chain amino acid transport system ATP-binding protein